VSYFRIKDDVCTLPWYVWADNKQHALRKVESLVGGISARNGREVCFAIERDVLPEDADVIDEPEDQREARLEESEE
jgi:hypothetical protein